MLFSFAKIDPSEKCFICNKQPIWLLKDKGESRKYYYYSLKGCAEYENICAIRIDDCIFKDSAEKCDFVLERVDHSHLHYIELKGSDLDKAAAQILTTIERTLNKIKETPSKINARAILSRVRTPDIRSTLVTKLKILCKKYGDGTFIYKSQEMHETAEGRIR